MSTNKRRPDLRKLRIEYGLTQAELAAETGLDKPTISRIENGMRPSPFAALKLEDWSGKPAGEWLRELGP